MTTNNSYRAVIGERLKAFREERGLHILQISADGGISPEQVEAVESGAPYSADTLFAYIRGCGLYIFFAEKAASTSSHDFEDMAAKAAEADPRLGQDAALQAARRAFGLKLRAAREAAGLSQYSLADKAGLKRPHIARIESGRYNVTLDTITRLSTALGVPL